MINRQKLKRALTYIGIIFFCSVIGGDFGMAAGIFICYMLM